MHVQFSKVISHRPGVPFWYYVSLTMYLNAPVVINSDSFRPPCVDPRRDGGGWRLSRSLPHCANTPHTGYHGGSQMSRLIAILRRETVLGLCCQKKTEGKLWFINISWIDYITTLLFLPLEPPVTVLKPLSCRPPLRRVPWCPVFEDCSTGSCSSTGRRRRRCGTAARGISSSITVHTTRSQAAQEGPGSPQEW